MSLSKLILPQETAAAQRQRFETGAGDHVREANDIPCRPDMPRLWSLLWRGAVGGPFGALLVLSYVIYKDPYTVVAGPSLLILILIAGANGCLVGTIIWLVRRLVRRRMGVLIRILLGTIITATLIGVYLYRNEGVGENAPRFITYSTLLGLIIGGPAGVMAENKLKSQIEKVQKQQASALNVQRMCLWVSSSYRTGQQRPGARVN